VSTALPLERSSPLLAVPLAGDQEEDFFLMRDIQERNRRVMPAELDLASLLEEAMLFPSQRTRVNKLFTLRIDAS
jgi:hypothetical protein